MSIPDDLSVIGFDGIAMAARPAFGLTAVRNSIPATVDAVLELLRGRPENPDRPAMHLDIEPELVLRGGH